MSNTYKSAGVDKEEGYKTVDKIKKAVGETHNSNVLNHLGSFGAFYEIGGYKNPVLVSGTDGVGTKLKVALDSKKYDSIGVDCFAMCANDILCHGAKPLFFLDYLACGKLDSEIAAEIVLGMVAACKDNNCALIGGETAEMPGMYKPGDYDVAGFCVGIVEKDQIIDGTKIKPGDKIIALPSSGFHSNGFSLVRKVFDMSKESLNTYYDELGKTLGEALLAPTRIYVKALKSVKDAGVTVKACSHITGGGFYENIPRMLPEGMKAVVKKDSYEVPAIFKLLTKEGDIAEEMMYNTFNMGLGMVVAVDKEDVDKTMEAIKAAGDTPYVVGRIEDGEKGVTLC